MRKSTLLSRFVLSGLIMVTAGLPQTVSALQPQPKQPPIPALSPFASTQARNTPFRAENNNPAAATLKNGMNALQGKNGLHAIAIRNKMPQQSLDRHILTWAIGMSGSSDIPSSEINNSLTELKGWPGINTIQMNSERAFLRENSSPKNIIAKFSETKPLTFEGRLALGTALIATGQKEKARAVIVPWWHTQKLSEKNERLLLKKLAPALTKADYYKHMKMMIYASRVKSAALVAKQAQAYSLYEAAVAVRNNEKNAEQKIAAVDPSLRHDPLYQFIQIQRLRRQDKIEEAAKLMLKAPQNDALIDDSNAWWQERRTLSREFLDKDDPQTAYQIVDIRYPKNAAFAADAEFHAGWYALRFLDDAQTAIKHFSRIPNVSSQPISIARGYYWIGRAMAATGNKISSNAYFNKAAHYGTTYYGQLAASHLGAHVLQVANSKSSTAEKERFEAREPIIAIKRLEAAGYQERAKTLYLELAKSLTDTGELTLLSAMAESKNNHYISLRIGKTAAARGLDVGALTHPVGAIPNSANISAAGKALAYAIARQESEFRVDAVSHVGARGMLQLMPATAKAVAKDHGIPYTQTKLTTDAAYNATLGAHFLGQQLERFDGSYVLTFIGYNAGPGRANQWIARYGDPRGKSIEEVVDWVERIPFTETRNYVMRVMENYETYKMRFTGKSNIKADLVSGRSS